MAITNEDMLALARTLPIPVPWDRQVFIDNLAKQRGRPIHLIPAETASLADSPCGLWLVREKDDLIIHEIGTSDYHIDQIICHEIGHMLLGHDRQAVHHQEDSPPSLHDDLFTTILPSIDPATIRLALGYEDHPPHDAATGDGQQDEETGPSVLSMIDPPSVRAVLGRLDYASDQEREAETFASLLMIQAADAGDEGVMMREVFFRK